MSSADDFWSSVPYLEAEREKESLASVKRDGATLAKLKVSRRSVMQTALVLGGAFGLYVVQALPTNRLTRARATVGTEHSNCDGYSYDNVLCTGFPYGTSYCGSDGWFLNRSTPSFDSYPLRICHSLNAWRWGTGGSRPRTYRCADGRQQRDGYSPHTYICSHEL